LAEAKGKDVKHAVEQIDNVYSALYKKMNENCMPLFDGIIWAAYICVHKGSSAPSGTKIQTSILDDKGIKCKVGKGDLDDFLRKLK
jgi:hypothetical protein